MSTSIQAARIERDDPRHAAVELRERQIGPKKNATAVICGGVPVSRFDFDYGASEVPGGGGAWVGPVGGGGGGGVPPH